MPRSGDPPDLAPPKGNKKRGGELRRADCTLGEGTYSASGTRVADQTPLASWVHLYIGWPFTLLM